MKSFYIRFSILFILSVVFITSCKKNPDVDLQSNAWLESSSKKDTIIFKNDGFMILSRPKEVRNGHLLPQLRDGLYFYRELKDSIFVQYSVSSYYENINYAFKIEGNSLYIGDFYNKSGKLLVFKKIK